MIEQAFKDELKSDGWILTAERLPKLNAVVDIMMVSGLGRYETRARLINDRGEWIDSRSGYNIYSAVVAWQEDSSGTDELQNHPFEPFSMGHCYASIGYWVGEGDEREFQILATMSDVDHFYSAGHFFDKVNEVAKIVGEGFADKENPLMIYHRQDSPDYVSSDGISG